MDLSSWFVAMVEAGASDLHLSSGASPAMRVEGKMRFFNVSVLNHHELEQAVLALTDEQIKQHYQQSGQADFACENKFGRFRVNIFNTLRGVAAVFRHIPHRIPQIKDLNLPQSVQTLIQHRQGLIVLTGATGSGKSTTLAALLNEINQTQSKHILTIEDPIEFIYENQLSLINQREIYRHSRSFAEALRSALREDPDVILLGEMRDPETIALALSAAETGHLVLTTLHSNNAPASIDRIIDGFEASEKNLIRMMLADSLRAVIAQTLLPKIGGGRVAACEILHCTAAVKNLIRENKISQLHSVLQTGSAQGMQTLQQSIQILFNQNLIGRDTFEYYVST